MLSPVPNAVRDRRAVLLASIPVGAAPAALSGQTQLGKVSEAVPVPVPTTLNVTVLTAEADGLERLEKV